MNVIPENGMSAILLLVLAIVLVIVFRSENMRGQMKKGMVFLLILAGIGLGYFLLTGKSPSHIPAAVDYYLNGPQAPPEKDSHRYYRDPEKRYGKQLAD